MRLIGVTLLALLLAALATLAWERRVELRQYALGPNARVAHYLGASEHERLDDLSGDITFMSFPMREGGNWVALSTLPGYARTTFDLPRSAHFERADIVIDFTAELEEDASAQLRLNVNGDKRGEIIISQGRSLHTARIPLTATDLTLDNLTVSISAQGRLKQVSCTRDWEGGALIQIEPTSHVEVAMEKDVASLEDRLRASGAPNRIVWPETAKAPERAAILAFAWERSFRGYDVLLEHEGHVSQRAIDLPQTVLGEVFLHGDDPWQLDHLEWPVNLLRNESDFAARRFEFETDWRLTYSRNDLPGRDLPTEFEFDLQLNSLADGNTWLMGVILNDRLVHTEAIQQKRSHITRRVSLPHPWQADHNVVEITLTSGEKKEGECASGTPAIAHLSAATLRENRGVHTLGAYEGVPAGFEGDIELRAYDHLNTLQANTAVEMLKTMFSPERTRWHDHASWNGQRIEIVRGDALAGYLDKLKPNRSYWIAHLRERTSGEEPYRVLPLTDQNIEAMQTHYAPRTVLLLSVPKPDLPEEDAQAADEGAK